MFNTTSPMEIFLSPVFWHWSFNRPYWLLLRNLLQRKGKITLSEICTSVRSGVLRIFFSEKDCSILFCSMLTRYCSSRHITSFILCRFAECMDCVFYDAFVCYCSVVPGDIRWIVFQTKNDRHSSTGFYFVSDISYQRIQLACRDASGSIASSGSGFSNYTVSFGNDKSCADGCRVWRYCTGIIPFVCSGGFRYRTCVLACSKNRSRREQSDCRCPSGGVKIISLKYSE